MIAANAAVYTVKEMTIAGRITIIAIIICFVVLIIFFLKRK
jgi:hypothetical protein